MKGLVIVRRVDDSVKGLVIARRVDDSVILVIPCYTCPASMSRHVAGRRDTGSESLWLM